jgi:predicted homoserine dehydrogenase-like protein
MTATESVAATWARSGQPVRVGIIGLGAREDLWACLAHLPALRAVPGFEVTALSTSSPESAARSGEIAHRRRSPMNEAPTPKRIPFGAWALRMPDVIAAPQCLDLYSSSMYHSS